MVGGHQSSEGYKRALEYREGAVWGIMTKKCPEARVPIGCWPEERVMRKDLGVRAH